MFTIFLLVRKSSMKNKFLIPVLLPFFLASCSARGVEGVYSFQLGKEDGRHMYACLELTNEKQQKKDDQDLPMVDENGNPVYEDGNIFRINMSMNFYSGIDEDDIPDIDSNGNTNGDPNQGQPANPEAGQDSEDKDTDTHIDGLYRIGETFRDGSKELLLNPNLFGAYIDSSYVELVIFATVTKKNVSITIPVSIADFVLQLYWYGYDVDFANFDIVNMPEEYHHPKGSHPTAAEVKAINDDGFADNHPIPSMLLDYFPYNFQFRDYNAVHLGLTKE